MTPNTASRLPAIMLIAISMVVIIACTIDAVQFSTQTLKSATIITSALIGSLGGFLFGRSAPREPDSRRLSSEGKQPKSETESMIDSFSKVTDRMRKGDGYRVEDKREALHLADRLRAVRVTWPTDKKIQIERAYENLVDALFAAGQAAELEELEQQNRDLFKGHEGIVGTLLQHIGRRIVTESASGSPASSAQKVFDEYMATAQRKHKQLYGAGLAYSAVAEYTVAGMPQGKSGKHAEFVSAGLEADHRDSFTLTVSTLSNVNNFQKSATEDGKLVEQRASALLHLYNDDFQKIWPKISPRFRERIEKLAPPAGAHVRLVSSMPGERESLKFPFARNGGAG